MTRRVTVISLGVIAMFVLAYAGLLPSAWRDVSAVVDSVWQHIANLMGGVV